MIYCTYILLKFDNEIDGSKNIFPVTEPESSHLLHHLLSAAQRALRVERTPIMLSNWTSCRWIFSPVPVFEQVRRITSDTKWLTLEFAEKLKLRDYTQQRV